MVQLKIGPPILWLETQDARVQAGGKILLIWVYFALEWTGLQRV